MYEALGVKDIDLILKAKPVPKPKDPALEHIDALAAQPFRAFPGQDHQAHITAHLNSELEEGELFLNLASNEYFGAVAEKALKVPVITPIFKDWKNDKLKVISFFAKKARGSMVRYIIDSKAKNLDDIKGFDRDDYIFSQEHTLKETEPVFIR